MGLPVKARLSLDADLEVPEGGFPVVDEEARAAANQAFEAAAAASREVAGVASALADQVSRLAALEGRPDDDVDDEARSRLDALEARPLTDEEARARIAALEIREDDDVDEEARALAQQALDAVRAGPGSSGTTAGQQRIDIASLPGVTAADKFREGVRLSAATGAIALYPNGYTIDVGPNPIDLLPHAEVGCGSGVATEFGRHSRLNVRATGGQAVFRPIATAGDVNRGKGWAFSHMEVFGTGREDLFETQAGDSSQAIMAYNVIDNVCANQLRRYYHGPMLGTKILGVTYWNNFTDTALAPSGSDARLFLDGLLFENGGVVDAAARSRIDAMIRMGHFSKSYLGPVYVTGSPTLPLSMSAGLGDVKMYGANVEGRPANAGGSLACWGPLMRLKGGGFKMRDGSLGYAMWQPAAGDKAYVHVSGGEHLFDGVTYMPYDGKWAPLFYAEGGRTTIRNIQRDPTKVAAMEAAGYAKPVVLVKNVAPAAVTDPAEQLRISRDKLVDVDSTVTVKLAA